MFEYNTDEHPEALDTEGRPYDRGTFGPVWLRWEEVSQPIEEFDPDLIICNAGGLSFRPEVAKRLRERVTLFGIALSDPEVFLPATSRIAGNFDYFLTNAQDCLSRYRNMGVAAFPWMPATYEGFYQPVPSKPEYECDVLIFGTAHADRVPSVRALLQYFNTHVYGERWDQHGIKSRGLVFGEESLSVLNSATITAVFCRTRDGHAIIKPYLFDFPAAGALVATDYLPGLERYFMLNREIIVFSSNDELIEKIKYYLDHPRDADAVRRAGRVRVLQDHTWRTVWPKTLRVLARNLNPDS